MSGTYSYGPPPISSLIIDPKQYKISQDIVDQLESLSSLTNEQKQNLLKELVVLKGNLIKKQSEFPNAIAKLIEQVNRFIARQQEDRERREKIPHPQPKQPALQQSIPQKSGSIRSGPNVKPQRGSVRGTVTKEELLNIWYQSEPLFKELPSDIDILMLFDTQLQSTFPKNEHWTTKMRKAVEMYKRTSKPVKIESPPDPPPSASDTSSEWGSIKLKFQIEDLQKQNKSTIHCLISALVSVPAPIIQQKPKDLMHKYHPLIPEFEKGNYGALPFETRLDCELISLGLEAPKDAPKESNAAFEGEIRSLRKEIQKLDPQIEEFKRQIMSNLPKYRQDDQERFMRQEKYHNMEKMRKLRYSVGR